SKARDEFFCFSWEEVITVRGVSETLVLATDHHAAIGCGTRVQVGPGVLPDDARVRPAIALADRFADEGEGAHERRHVFAEKGRRLVARREHEVASTNPALLFGDECDTSF